MTLRLSFFILSGDLIRGLPTHQGYDKDLFLLAESHDHSTVSYTMAVVEGFVIFQPSKISEGLIKH